MSPATALKKHDVTQVLHRTRTWTRWLSSRLWQQQRDGGSCRGCESSCCRSAAEVVILRLLRFTSPLGTRPSSRSAPASRFCQTQCCMKSVLISASWNSSCVIVCLVCFPCLLAFIRETLNVIRFFLDRNRNILAFNTIAEKENQ